jgi:predicted dehydrogenase
MNRVRIAVIGCGSLARQVHLPILKELADVVALCDSQEESLQKAAAICPQAQLFNDYRECLDGSVVDACLVCTSTPAHFNPALDVIERGLPLYLEKPVAETTEQAKALEAARRESHSLVVVGCNFRLNPLFRRLSESDLSQTCSVRSTFTTVADTRPDWVFHSGATRGTLLELGSHELDLFCSLFGWDVQTVWARTKGRSVSLQMETSSGLSYQGLFSLESCEEARFEVYTASRKLAVDRYQSWCLEVSGLRTRGLLSRLLQDLEQVRHLSYGLKKLRAPANELSYQYAWLDFFGVLGGQAGILPRLEDGIKVMELIDAAEASIASGSPVLL